MSCKIIPTRGHFEIYINGEFYCSADNMMEAVNEIENYRKQIGG